MTVGWLRHSTLVASPDMGQLPTKWISALGQRDEPRVGNLRMAHRSRRCESCHASQLELHHAPPVGREGGTSLDAASGRKR